MADSNHDDETKTNASTDDWEGDPKLRVKKVKLNYWLGDSKLRSKPLRETVGSET